MDWGLGASRWTRKSVPFFPVQGVLMAKRTISSKKRKKQTGTATPKLDASRLFLRQYPLEQLCEPWVRQLEDRLKNAGSAEAATVSAELALERQVLSGLQRTNALTGKRGIVWKPGPVYKVEAGGREPGGEGICTLAQLEPLASRGSVLASYITGATFQKMVLADEIPQFLPEMAEKRKQKDMDALTKAMLQAAGDHLIRAAERGFAPAYYELALWYRNRKDTPAAEQWFARALEAQELPALLERETMILLELRPLPAEELQASLERLHELALKHCWGALEMLALVCEQRRENETVKAFTPGVLLLLQDLARQGFAPAMLALGSYYDTILLAPDAGHRDKRAHHWYDRAAEHGLVEALVSSVRAGFCGPVYTGALPVAITELSLVTAPDEATAAEIKGLLGRLYRQKNVSDALSKQSGQLLIEAALAGNPYALCSAIRSEIVWANASVGKSYPADTLLNDRRLNKVPHVLFTRGQTMLNYPGEHKANFRQRALKYILTAAEQGSTEAICWLADATLRGLYGVPQNPEKGLDALQTGLAARLPRAMALDALRQLGWIRGIPGEEHADRAWIRELLGMSASADDCLGYAALVLLEALEPVSPKRQKELGADLARAFLWAHTQADASALFLLGCVASLHMEDPSLNAVCRHYNAEVCRKTGKERYTSDFAAHMAASAFHCASLVGEPKGMMLTVLVEPTLGNLSAFRKEKGTLEQLM